MQNLYGARAPKHLVLSALAVALLSAAPQPAHAYIDPGTGGMALQALLACAAAVLVGARSRWGRIRDLFRRRRGPSQD